MSLTEFIDQLLWIPSIDVTIIDIIQIAIISLSLYYLTKSLYKTRAWILVKGLLIIGAVYLIVCLTNMEVIRIIMQALFSTLMIAIIIMLQPELQKIVEIIGQKHVMDIKSFFNKKTETPTWYSSKSIHEIVTACESMSAVKTGALIVIERGIPLTDSIQSGIDIGSSISNQLLINIFEKNTPLHDGAVIIKDDKVEAATCYLPLTTNNAIDKTHGTRHRAAIGISEQSDCVVIVVSEETGHISFCINGKIYHHLNRAELTKHLESAMKKDEGLHTTRKKSKTPLWIKIAAPILGAAIWMFAVFYTDPITTATIRDVPVTIINEEKLDTIGQTYAIQSGDTIDVVVEGKRSLVDSITADDIVATADLTNMSMVYAIPIDVSLSERYNDLKIVSSMQVMKVQLEELVQVEVPVEIEITGNDHTDHMALLDEVERQTVSVKCPEDVAKTLSKAVLTVDAYGKTKDFIVTVSPVIYDKNGTQIPEKRYSVAEKDIRVSVKVFDVVEIPITIEIVKQDTNADIFYILKDYQLENNILRVAASRSKLAEISEIVLTIDPSKTDTQSVLIDAAAQLPDGVYLAKNQDSQVKAEIDCTKMQKISFTVADTDISLIGHDTQKYKATLTAYQKTITLLCDTSVIDPKTITLKTLNLSIQTSNTTGTHHGIILCTDVEGVETLGDWSASYTIESLKR